MIVLKVWACFSKRFSLRYAASPRGRKSPPGDRLSSTAQSRDNPAFILPAYLLCGLMAQRDLKPPYLSISEVKRWAFSLTVTSRKLGTFLK